MHFSIKNIVKASAFYSLSQWTTALLGMVLLPVYTRVFSTEVYGVYVLINTSIVFLTMALQLGMEDAITRFFSASKSEEERRQHASTTLLFKLYTYIPVLCVAILFSSRLSLLLFGSEAYARVIAWALASVFATGIFSFLLNMLRLRFKATLYAAMSVLQLLSQLALTLYFVIWARSGIIGIYWAALITAGLFSVPLFIISRHYFTFIWRPATLKNLLLFGLPVLPSTVACNLMDYLNRYFIAYYRDLGEVGVYGIAYMVSSILLIGMAGFTMAWGPYVCSSFTKPGARQIMARTLNYFNAIMTSVAVAIALFARELLYAFTTPQYYAAASVVGLIVFGALLFQVTSVFGVGIAIAKKMHIRMWCSLAAAGANLLLNWLLIPSYGMVGAAWATLLSYMLFGTILMIGSELCFHIPYAYGRNITLWLAGGGMVAAERFWLSGLPTSAGTIALKAMLVLIFLLIPFGLRLIPSYVVRASLDAVSGRNGGLQR